ncbi:MAG: hypothetical protein BMS9Abin07_1507 [Acidimicrobiia bacterium]|nr:MAG: hypothetical protein BMS9Abin07_1507 [Acidimicrobiia bacterium]
MPVSRVTLVFLSLAILVAACTSVDGGGDGAAADSQDVDAYAAAVTKIMTRPGSEDDYPIGGSTVRTTRIFLALEEGLADLSAVPVPDAIRAEHTEVVARIEAVQDKVARYLQQHAVSGDDISVRDISYDADISPLIGEARAACLELGRKLDQLGITWSLGLCLV